MESIIEIYLCLRIQGRKRPQLWLHFHHGQRPCLVLTHQETPLKLTGKISNLSFHILFSLDRELTLVRSGSIARRSTIALATPFFNQVHQLSKPLSPANTKCSLLASSYSNPKL
jgi:hypothetical protein